MHRLVHAIVAQGAIGQVCSVHAEFALQIPYDPAHRHFDLEQGGGSLLDAGVHPLRPAHWYLGELTAVGATRRLGLWRAEHTALHRQGHDPQPLYRPAQGGAHLHQTQEGARCLRQGRTQSPVMPWAHSQALAQTLDRVRDIATLLPEPAHLTNATQA